MQSFDGRNGIITSPSLAVLWEWVGTESLGEVWGILLTCPEDILWFQSAVFNFCVKSVCESEYAYVVPLLYIGSACPSGASAHPPLHLWTLTSASFAPVAFILRFAFFLLPRQWPPWGPGSHLLHSCVCCIVQHSVWHVANAKSFKVGTKGRARAEPSVLADWHLSLTVTVT